LLNLLKLQINPVYFFGGKVKNIIFVLVFCFLVLSGTPVDAQSPPPIVEYRYIEAGTAINAARIYLPRFFKGDWEYFQHIIYYDLDNTPSAIAVIFTRPTEEGLQSLEEIERSFRVQTVRQEQLADEYRKTLGLGDLSGKQKSQRLSEINNRMNAIERSMKGSDRFITVVTGARDTQPVVIKCHRGLPETIAEKERMRSAISKQSPNAKLQPGKTYFLGMFDSLQELTALDSGGKKLYHFRTGKLLNEADITARYQANKEQRRKVLDLKRVSHNRSKWLQYSTQGSAEAAGNKKIESLDEKNTKNQHETMHPVESRDSKQFQKPRRKSTTSEDKNYKKPRPSKEGLEKDYLQRKERKKRATAQKAATAEVKNEEN
jgi:hypothetical protein